MPELPASGGDRGDGDAKQRKKVTYAASGGDRGDGDAKRRKKVVSAKDGGEGDKTCSATTTEKSGACGVIRDEENEAKHQDTKATPTKLDRSNETKNMPGVLDGPIFQLLTQDVELGADVDDTDNTETSVPPDVQKSDGINQEDEHSKEEETKNTINGKGTAENDITHKAWVNELESRR
ncbi:hypothetical protein HanLR1_Chr02g0051631 [Helianthus annuus]|nr:hypothetical protein HanLR1_Chr02g0051631 [Helianthus annuus]